MQTARSARRALINVLIWSLCIAAFVLIAVLLSGNDDEPTARVFLTFLALSLYSGTSVAGLSAWARPQARPVAVLIWVFSGIGFMIAALAVWDTNADEALQRLAWALAVCAISASQLGLIAVRARSDDTPAIRAGETATAAAVLLLAGLAVRAITAEVDDEGYYRVMGAVGIADAYGTFAIPVIRLLRLEAGSVGARRGFLLVLLGTLTLASAAGMIGLVRDSVDEDLGRLLATLPFAALFGGTAMAGVAVRRLPAHALLGDLTIAASGLALLAVLNLIWVSDFSFDGGSDTALEWAWSLLVVAGTLAHVSVLVARRRPGDSPLTATLTRWATAVALVAGAMLVYPVLDDDTGSDYAVGVAIVLILDVLATTVAALVRKRDSATV